ncbi:hypothetical protein ACJVDH_17190 [Pedobacter sp. AW1-32]|uniref:hypothetical protein n=1 Tax=Pedobacter sp. AW1-32 TaxID=3383026 RepID=UPI003FEDD078
MKHAKENKWDANFSEFGEVEWDLDDVTYGHFNIRNSIKKVSVSISANPQLKKDTVKSKGLNPEFLSDDAHTRRNISGIA